MTPVRLPTGDSRLEDVLALIRSSFAYMDGRINPPSSVVSLDLAAVNRQAEAGEIWGLGEPLEASVFLTPKSDASTSASWRSLRAIASRGWRVYSSITPRLGRGRSVSRRWNSRPVLNWRKTT